MRKKLCNTKLLRVDFYYVYKRIITVVYDFSNFNTITDVKQSKYRASF